MAKDRLAFEQLQPALHKWARHFRNNRFQHWELINAVWGMGRVQKLKHIQYASARVRYDMIEYIRKQLGRTPKPYTHNLIHYDHEKDIEENLRDKHNVFQQIEISDFFEVLLKGFSRREKIAIRLRYELDFAQPEIAKVMGVTQSRVSQILAHTHEIIKARIVK